ncbi:RelA/SpoT domain-containing protein [Sphingomonas ursincola]|jgi:ppGpp synthetase/RelA/SpoT-type nucleotidyltranferase|uniref:RelA/SpoT domain-containing protein n=1 Tax=Sphingomonas ursincola TaxID=56361 RepID=UPI002355DFA9|nr:RelA/SpoT domain-containing protein [Sphingomonas ursincola]MBY0621559.1 RelA/SpoT domain-containing protein [Sphingomonas ursincola]
MSDFETPRYSKRQVVEAGKLLKGRFSIPSNEAIEAFKIAHNWRACHILPMRHLRAELSGKVRKVGADALTAARLKRMTSIRMKLRRGPHTLYQMQDIAGCRVIMANQASVERLRELYRSEARHTFIDEDDYIAQPKATGYRGRHLVYRYFGQGNFEGLNSNPQFVEIQLRTKMQHAWATAVEAVGMARNEDLKGGQGNEDWLRFFALMASDIAALEGGVVVPNTPESESDRRHEIIALERGLNALEKLEGYRNVLKITEFTRTASPFFLIQFDQQNNKVSVKGVSAKASYASLDLAEKSDQINSVLVEVDKLDDLRSAYPNYFMDVRIFTDQLRDIIKPPRALRLSDGEWLRSWMTGRRR